MPQSYKAGLIVSLLIGILYIKRSFIMYGLISKKELYDITDKVVECLGGGDNARALLLETASAETLCGEAIDDSWSVGMGVFQFDKIGFNDVKARTSKANANKVHKCFGIDINKVVYSDLRYSPLLGAIFCRLKYILVPKPIPADIQSRADYWKVYYNSVLGSGTVEHYISNSIATGAYQNEQRST